MISNDVVFDSVRRGYNELEASNNSEIIDYFENIDPDAMVGHISNIKGIVFEQEVVNALNEQGFDAMMFEATNHPISDIALMSDGDIALEMQLKATDSTSYINTTLDQHSDVPIIVTSEVANGFDSAMVINSGLDNAALETVVSNTLLSEGTNDVAIDSVSEGLGEVIGESLLPIPISPIGLIGTFIGLPFL
jgi:Holliday junction resolvase